MKNDTEFHAVNCRIPKQTYKALHEIASTTGKTAATTVADSIEYYVRCVQGKTEPTKPLKIDQFAWNLNTK
jgi:hypothetical protein